MMTAWLNQRGLKQEGYNEMFRLQTRRTPDSGYGLGFEIEPGTLAAIKEASAEIQKISSERVRDELVQILSHPNRLQGFDLLVGTGLMAEILLGQKTSLESAPYALDAAH